MMEDRLLTMPEAAKHLRLSRSQLYTWIQKGWIEPVRLPSGKLRIPISELERAVNAANPDRRHWSFWKGAK